MELYCARDRYSMKLHMAGDDMKAREPWSSLTDKRNDGPTSTSLNTWGVVSAGNFQNKKADSRSQVSTYGLYRKDALNGPEPQVNHTGLSVARKKRVHAQVLFDMLHFSIYTSQFIHSRRIVISSSRYSMLAVRLNKYVYRSRHVGFFIFFA